MDVSATESGAKMGDFENDLRNRLKQVRAAGLFRELREVDSAQGPDITVNGRGLLNFSSNDYLGLAGHPALKEAAIKAVEKFGAGSGASRLICGSLAPHHALEEALAAFKETGAAVSFSSGYAAALGVVTALMEKDDVVIMDKLVHASLVDAARLSGAKLRIFRHNDLADLERILRWADGRVQSPGSKAQRPRTLIVTESVFSMDGDLAPLRDIVALKERYGAWLMVDEAHATGLFGANRRGLAEAFEVAERIDVQMGTLGKAVGSAGGYVCASRALIDLLINRARSFIFSTAPVPAQSAAAHAGIEMLQSAEGETRRVRLWSRVDSLKNALTGGAWQVPVVQSPILPLIVGTEERAAMLAGRLRALGLFVPAIRYPSVARGAARLRITVNADHTDEQIRQLSGALAAAACDSEGPGDATSGRSRTARM